MRAAMRRLVVVVLGGVLLGAAGCASAAGGHEDDSFGSFGDAAGETAPIADASSGGFDGASAATEDAGAASDADVEICGNGLDDNGDDRIDEGCTCSVGATQSCYVGNPKNAGVGVCSRGKQTCEKSGELPAWGKCIGSVLPGPELCPNKLDDDCDGKIDDGCVPPAPDAGPPPPVDAGPPPGCTVEVKIDIDGDCVSAKCPASAPYPVGCDVAFIGDTPCGCVAGTPTSSSVFFKEGKSCGSGHLTGTIQCSCKVGAGLNATNCKIKEKTYKYYPTSSAGCPTASCPI